jgi:chitodextrinase
MSVRTSLLPVLMLAACSGGLRALPKDTADTGALDLETPNETGLGDPLDPTDDGDNTAPVANAGDDATGNVGEVVVLDGSDSYDPDGDPFSHYWEFVSVPATSSTYLINDTREDPSFYADAEGTYVIRLTVDDGRAEGEDEVTVDVAAPNDAPYADAGPDQTVTVGDVVQLNGSASWDPDGDSLTFAWTFITRPSGSGATLSDTTSPLPSFTADAAGRYEIALVVDDGGTVSSQDIVAVTAQEADSGGGLCLQGVNNHTARQLASGRLNGAPLLGLLPLLALLAFRRDRRQG